MNERMRKVLRERLVHPVVKDECIKAEEIIEKLSGMELAKALNLLMACSEVLSGFAVCPGPEVKDETTAACDEGRNGKP